MSNTNIPVLMYHKITPRKEFGVTTLSPSKFESQMKWLHENGYKSASGLKRYGESEVIITFDDAYECVYEYAFPIMNKYGFKAVIFPVSEFIGKMNTWDANLMGIKFRHMHIDQIRTLLNAGWELGAHSASHKVRKIKQDPIYQIIESKKMLESEFKTPVQIYSYPFGYRDDTIQKVVENHFKTAFSASTHNQDDHYYRSRIPIYSFDTNRTLMKKLKHSMYALTLANLVHHASYATILYQNLKYQFEEGSK